MKTNTVRAKLRRGEPTFGTWLTLDSLHSARALARVGFDWLTVDLEHSPLDWSAAAALFAAIADSGCVPLARVPEGNHAQIKRALDAGAWGIVVPMVETIEQGQAAIAAAKYPPLGNRSAGGSLPALSFHATSAEYLERANDEILVILQTESPQGVDNAHEIYSLPGLDAVFIGPLDLACTLRGRLGRVATAEEHEAMVQRVIAAGRRAGVPTGIHCREPEEAICRARQGMQFLAVGSDLRMLLARAEGCMRQLEQSAVGGQRSASDGLANSTGSPY